MRGKKPLSEKQVVALRKLVEGNELHELLLNLGVDLMLRASDLLNLKVSDVLNESGSVKEGSSGENEEDEENDIESSSFQKFHSVIKKYLLERKERISSFGQLIITTRENLFQSISIPESSKIG